jgi:hypothetical protein
LPSGPRNQKEYSLWTAATACTECARRMCGRSPRTARSAGPCLGQ